MNQIIVVQRPGNPPGPADYPGDGKCWTCSRPTIDPNDHFCSYTCAALDLSPWLGQEN